MIELIAEQIDMNPKDYIKNLGMEIDEDYGVLPDALLSVK
jgi:hypothetical protein